MKFARLIVALLCAGMGFVAGYAWHVVSMSSVSVEGILAYEEPVHPALTPTYPPGYYLAGRIYLDGIQPDMVGKRVVLSGALTVQGHPETLTYPKIAARDIWAGPAITSVQDSAEVQPQGPALPCR